MSGPISQFIRQHYRHFNAATLVDAADGYVKLLDEGGRMFLAMAGAMSTAELGISLAEMIRQRKIHGISCTGANLEEDLYNLVAHDYYERIPNYRDLTPQQEKGLLDRKLNRVTDTCIPEEEAMRRLESKISPRWKGAEEIGTRKFPHEFFYDLLLSGELEELYQVDPTHSWMLAAAQQIHQLLHSLDQFCAGGAALKEVCVREQRAFTDFRLRHLASKDRVSFNDF